MNNGAGLAARTWVSPELWIEGGFGLGHAIVSGYDGTGGARGPAVLCAIGGELTHSSRVVLDLQLLGSMARLDGGTSPMVALALGVTWH